jgi:hypothetical protein
MEMKQSRREFMGQCAKISGVCGALLAWNSRLRAEEQEKPEAKKGQKKKPMDPKQLAYCGISCAQCHLHKLTIEDDVKKKQAVFEKNPEAMKEDLGIGQFDPDKIFCHSCKPGDKPLRFGMDKCVIRNCAIAHGVETCAQCKKISTCENEETWRWFSDPRRHRLMFLRAGS